MLVHDPEHQELNAVVYDQDFIGSDKEVGRFDTPYSAGTRCAA